LLESTIDFQFELANLSAASIAFAYAATAPAKSPDLNKSFPLRFSGSPSVSPLAGARLALGVVPEVSLGVVPEETPTRSASRTIGDRFVSARTISGYVAMIFLSRKVSVLYGQTVCQDLGKP
jgi:hypothetical protein